MARPRPTRPRRARQAPQIPATTAQDAADNPDNPSAAEDVEMSVNEGQTVRRSVRLRPGASDLAHDNALDSGQSRAINDIVEDITDAISDRPLDYDENGDSRHKSSDLSPIEDLSEIRSIQKDATSPMLKRLSPPDGENDPSEERVSSQSDWIRQLEENARITNERLTRAREEERIEHASNHSRVSRTLEPTGSKVDQDLVEPSPVSDKNVKEAMCNLHTPTCGTNETPDEHDARLAASARLRQDRHEADLREQRRLRLQEELRAEHRRLREEKREHDAIRRSWKNREKGYKPFTLSRHQRGI